MARFRYTSYAASGRVCHMRVLRISYLFAVLVASYLAPATPCSAQVRLYAQVLATDECQLAPASFNGLCVQRVVPIEGELSLRLKGKAGRMRVNLTDSGSFSKKLTPGRYAVRLLSPQVNGRKLKRSAYRITPARFTLTKNPAPGAGRARSALFLVAHRSREIGVSVGISDGLQKPIATLQ
jgi:hypothetical protein